MPPLVEDEDSWENSPETAVWRERERRQRTIRLLMMFLVMLLLMDGEEGAQRRQQNALRKRQKKKEASRNLEANVFEARQSQDHRIRAIVARQARYAALAEKNGGEHVDETVMLWAEHYSEQEKDQFAESAVRGMHPSSSSQAEKDPEEDRTVFHYPWNATGFYRGEWSREVSSTAPNEHASTMPVERRTSKEKEAAVVLDAASLENTMLKVLEDREDAFGVVILPDGFKIEMRDDNNLTNMKWEDLRTDTNNAIVRAEIGQPTNKEKEQPATITLMHDSGRAAFQFFSRSIPSMQELSLVDGFIKIYDSTSPGYSTRKDILLRVRGVLIHAIGRLSLVSNVDVSRSVLVLGGEKVTKSHRRRRLQEALSNLEVANVESVRDDVISLFSDSSALGEPRPLFSSPEFAHRRLDLEEEGQEEQVKAQAEEHPQPNQNETVGQSQESRRILESTEPLHQEEKDASLVADGKAEATPITKESPAWSDIVIPYPFVRDDSKETVRRTKTPAARLMPPREQALEANSAGCGFEINLDAGEVEWTIGAWRNLVSRKVNDRKRLDPSSQPEDGEDEMVENIVNLRGSRPKPIQDQALVMSLVGTIHSPNCDFTATLNVTALRTDWDATTSKAINYSFVMMLVCLTQILVLLRQLLHSQGQSTASRVSLLCIGWQTLLDALLCLAHIYMSLSIQPLFSAIASVAFFKMLIFCVIEMKYMAIIIQARNSSNGGQSTDVLRRQIAMLHLRFYTALAGSFLLLFYVGDKYRIFYVLGMYSFWVPQIILNVVTEAKAPMHTYYIYGMSATRLIAPLFMFAIKNNFLKEVYPEAPHDPFTYQMLVLWISFQTAVLIGQGKYGARFMIPARFLPPKFDYSRPLPAAMLPPGAVDLPVPETIEDRDDTLKSSQERQALIVESESSRGLHKTAVTTRNRIRGKKRTNRSESGMMTTEEHAGVTSSSGDLGSTATTTATAAHTLDCSICYDAIDVRKRHDYMLAPCNHLFHRECLVQWMDVKMECPICRTELPAL
jgi:hypothetical protein